MATINHKDSKQELLEKKQLLAKIKTNGVIIKKHAETGFKLAIKVIKWYDMWRKCPSDNASYIMTKEFYEEWESSYEKD